MKKLLCVWGASNYGKTSSIIEFDSLTLFGKNNCDIIVCASRTKGETVANVCNFCKRNGYDLYWISTIHSSSISLFNHHGAQVSQRNGQIIFDVVSDFMRGRY